MRERGARCSASESRSAAAVLFTDSTGALRRGGLCSTSRDKSLLSSDAGRLNSESHHSSLSEFSMSLMSTASFVRLTIFSLSDVVVVVVSLIVAESSSLSCFNTEMPATCLSSVRPCSSSLFVGVHLKLVQLAAVDGGVTDVVVVVDVVVRTLLKGVASDDNFCARIFTGKFQTAPLEVGSLGNESDEKAELVVCCVAGQLTA